MAKFKVGDKVVRMSRAPDHYFYKWLPVRDFYVVTKVSTYGGWIQVDKVAPGGTEHPWCVDSFVLYQEPPTPKKLDTIWDLSVATTLRHEAESAVAKYNDYIKLQPEQLQPITVR